jgi:hypothetical protein
MNATKLPATLLTTDGASYVIKPKDGTSRFSLKELQGYVGGFVEVVHLDGPRIMVVNEDGKAMKLPPHERATTMAHAFILPGDYIAGPAVVCNIDEFLT